MKHNGTFSLKDKKISIKYNSDYVLLHEIGHFVNYKNGDAAHSSEFYNIYLKERSKYRGFYNDYYEKLDLENMKELLLRNILPEHIGIIILAKILGID